MRKISRASLKRAWKKTGRRSLKRAVALFVLGVLMLAGTVAALAASPGVSVSPRVTPSVSPTISATPSPTPQETPLINSADPTISFIPEFTMMPEDEFFGEGRTNVADYENPAYTADESDDPTITGESVVEEFIADLFEDNAETMDLVIMLTLLGLVPSLMIMLTGFSRIVIVLSFVRNAMGTNNMPPNMVIIGLALFLTFFVMSPVLSDIQEDALVPYLEGEINIMEATELAMEPIRWFMLYNTYPTDLELFWSYSGEDIAGKELVDAPTHVLIPAFLVSEIKHAFILGFFIYIPFIVIDMVVASTLMSMGMMMLPPVMISLPFKVLLFVSVDGWELVIQTLLASFYYY